MKPAKNQDNLVVLPLIKPRDHFDFAFDSFVSMNKDTIKSKLSNNVTIMSK